MEMASSVCSGSPLGLDPLVQAASVCISPDFSSPGRSREDSPGWGSSAASKPILAGLRLFLGRSVSPGWLSLGDSISERLSVASRGHKISSPAREVELWM